MFSSFDEYKKEYYADAEVKLLQDFNHWLGTNEDEQKGKWLAAMRDILHKAAQAQSKLEEKGRCVHCRYLQCSFLYVSFYQDKPVFQVELYDDNRQEPWLVSWLDVHDILAVWKPFKEKALAKEGWISRYYSESVIGSLFPQTIEKVLYLILCHWHYWTGDLILQGDFRDLRLSEKFQMTVGQYRGWQEPIYTINPPQDIYLHGGKSLLATDFYRTVYRAKTIVHEDVTEARFWDCKWETIPLQDVNFTDVIFVKCRFYRVDFTDCCFVGARFADCTFVGCNFRNCDGNPESGKLPDTKIYKGVSWHNCHWENCTFDHCDLSYARLSEDIEEHINLRCCQVESSDFQHIKQEAVKDD